MKNLRKLTYAAAFLLAIGSSFAFTQKQEWDGEPAFYVGPDTLCDDALLYDPFDECSTTNSGTLCVVYDPEIGLPFNETAYSANFGSLCLFPYRKAF